MTDYEVDRLGRRINAIETLLTFVGCVAAAAALWWLVAHFG